MSTTGNTSQSNQGIFLESLWNQFHARLCRFICSQISDEDDAEDILQDVFVRIHFRLDTIREIDKIESWMYQVARNSIIDYYRSRSKLTGLKDEQVNDDPMPEESTAESLSPYIRELVNSLPEPYREAIILTDYQGMSQKDMAAHLGISISGAKSRVQRARQKIKDLILECCHVEFDARGTVFELHEHCCCCCEIENPTGGC